VSALAHLEPPSSLGESSIALAIGRFAPLLSGSREGVRGAAPPVSDAAHRRTEGALRVPTMPHALSDGA
jgi:hypothetical protein